MSGGWEKFCDDHRIPYRKGSGGRNIEIHCPMCGFDDKSQHMGLHLLSPVWGCWKNTKHRGGDAAILIQKILRIPYADAQTFAKQYFDFQYRARRATTFDTNKSLAPIPIPDDFFEFTFEKSGVVAKFERPFLDYLHRRGLDPEYTSLRYGLRWCVTGESSNRLIIPIIKNNEWFSFIARDITNTSVLRYKAVSKDDACQPNRFLFDIDNLRGGETLLLLEGVFDVFKVANCFIANLDVSAIFGKILKPEQIGSLMELSPLYERIILCLDPDAFADNFALWNEVAFFVPNLTVFPYRISTMIGKDFGDEPYEKLKPLLIKLLTDIRRKPCSKLQA